MPTRGRLIFAYDLIEMSNTGPDERRRKGRKRSDPKVVRVRLKDRTGNLRWVIAYLSDVTEGGAGIALMTRLEIGSRVVIHGNLGEGRSDVQLDADVRWCTQGIGGVFNVGLKLLGGPADATA
jgi:hypothetical protein